MLITNIFKFFPSHAKLIIMDNTDLLRGVIKVAVRVVWNLREEERDGGKRRWKLSAKVRAMLRDMGVGLMDRIGDMFRFLFVVGKAALDLEVERETEGRDRT